MTMTEVENGDHSHHNGHHRREETEEERRIRKEKERRDGKERRKETEEERAIRKEKERKARENETEEERRIRKEKEKRDGKEKRKETEEERAARKEKERREKKSETEEERRIRKEKEKKEGHERRRETSEERRIRKEKERKAKEGETEEERRARKEKERRKETEEERAARKEKERREKKQETEEERAARKERERAERKEKEKKAEVKAEMMELGDEYFAAEEAKLSTRPVKEEEENGYGNGHGDVKDEDEEDTKDGIIKEEVPMDDSDDETPLARRKKPQKRKSEWDEDSDDEPLSKKKAKKKKKQHSDYDDEEEEEDYEKPKKSKTKPKPKTKTKQEQSSPTKKMTKKEKEAEAEKQVWKWWEEEEQLPEGVKWRSLEHKGPMLAPEYERLPKSVKFWYNGQEMRLSEDTEECATFYGRMLDHDYTTKEVFNKNFFKDWRKTMTASEKETIRDLSKCDFSAINQHFKDYTEQRKNRSKEEKKAEKEKNDAIVEEYGFCMIDGHREKIGNFRIEPPGLFRGRGEHPKQGMIKRRTMPEDVIINCSKDSVPPAPPKGHKWKKVQHDNTVTWLASWTENIQGQIKYVMLNPSSRLKGEKDWQKYEKARKLKGEIDKIREEYMADMKSKEMRIRQRAVALYFIDKLALRAGNEKDEDQADTVGCCSLRVEHIELHDEKNGEENVVEFDFLGKDSIRYNNSVPVEKRVFKNLKLFMENKKDADDLFDRLNTSILNQYLQQLMEGLTAKVFRYHPSRNVTICQFFFAFLEQFLFL